MEGSETLKLVHPGAPKWPDSTFLSKKSTDTRVVVKAKLNVLWHSKPNCLITAASYSSRAVMAVIFEAGIKGEHINQLFVIIPSSSQNKVINDHIILRYWSFVSSRCVNTQTVKPQCLHYSFQRDILMFNSFIKDINPDKIISGSISGPIELDDHIQTIPESTGQPRVKGHAELCGSVTQTWTSGCWWGVSVTVCLAVTEPDWQLLSVGSPSVISCSHVPTPCTYPAPTTWLWRTYIARIASPGMCMERI